MFSPLYSKWTTLKGRASMISQTWSQITGNEKSSSLANSPMTTLTSSPMVRGPPAGHATPSSTTGAKSATGYYRHQPFFSSPSLGNLPVSGQQSANESMVRTTPSRQTSLSPNYETAIDSLGISNLSDSLQLSVKLKETNINNYPESNGEKIGN